MLKRTIFTMLAIVGLLTFTAGCGVFCGFCSWLPWCADTGTDGTDGTDGTNGTDGTDGDGADAALGEAFYAANGCTACHGADGSSPTNMQNASAALILANLDGSDTHPTTVAGVTQADADNLAAWLATQ